jgi:hypothetical protein
MFLLGYIGAPPTTGSLEPGAARAAKAIVITNSTTRICFFMFFIL